MYDELDRDERPSDDAAAMYKPVELAAPLKPIPRREYGRHLSDEENKARAREARALLERQSA